MKKGEIYEAVVEKIEFPNKGILHVEEEKVTRKKCHSRAEGTVCDQQKEKRKM